MKYGMFESYTEAVLYLLASAMVSGVIIWGILWLITLISR